MDIGIDLGTSNVLVYVKGRGVVINQPSVVAYEKSSKRIIAIGNKAKKMIGKTPESIEVVRPLVKGVVSDYIVTERMLKAFIRSAMEKRTGVGRPKICVCVPSGVTEVERRAVEEAVYRTGAKSSASYGMLLPHVHSAAEWFLTGFVCSFFRFLSYDLIQPFHSYLPKRFPIRFIVALIRIFYHHNA